MVSLGFLARLFSQQTVTRHAMLRRKLRHHRTALAALRLFAITLFVIVFFYVLPVAFIKLDQLIRYAPSQIINPGVLLFNLALASLFLLFFWKDSPLARSLVWMLFLLAVYDFGYIAGFITYVIVRPNYLGLGDWLTAPIYGLAILACAYAWARHVSIRAAVRTVIGVSVVSILATLILDVSRYGTVVGTGRALSSGLLGPFVALLGTIIRGRGDWSSRESKKFWFRSKNMESEDWTHGDEEVVEADIDSYDKTSRKATIHICRFDKGEQCEDRVLRVSGSLGNLVWDEIDSFKGKGAHLSLKQGQITAISFWGIPKGDDPEIFDVIDGLCSKLGITDVRANWLFWKHNELPVSIWPHFPGPPYWLLLDERLAGKLDPSEWEPLIMSTLVLHKRTRGRRFLELVQFPLTVSAIFLLGFPIFDVTLMGNRLGLTLRAIILLAGTMCSLCYLGVMRLVRKTRLDADRLAGERCGTTQFFEILTKVQKQASSPRDKSVINKLLRLFKSEPTVEGRHRSIARGLKRSNAGERLAALERGPALASWNRVS